MAGVSNTQRTLKFLKDRGCKTAIVERFLAYAGAYGQRKDMFGFADIVALVNNEIWAVQSCGQAFSEDHKTITQQAQQHPQ